VPNYLQLIAEGHPGTRCDVTPIFADAAAFAAATADLVNMAAPFEHDLVAGIDALGFILGGAVASREGKGFVAIRKGGKLPVEVHTATFVDYSGEQKSLELRADAFPAGSRILLIDEWIETGAQARAAIELISQQSGVVVAIGCINCDSIEKTAELRAQCPVLQLIAAG
jgi:adenine phosphoribosyltransferase